VKLTNLNLKKSSVLIFLLVLFVFSFSYRLYGLTTHNPPFWVDEFASANQGKLFLKYGLSAFNNPNIYIENYNITTHLLIAVFYKLFGINEFSARLPLVFIGSIIPIIVYFLTKKIFDLQTAISASLLTVFSYFEIVWSRQARSYITLQFLTLTTLYLYLKFNSSKKLNKSLTAILLILFFLGIITHPLYYILLLTLFCHFILRNFKLFLSFLKSLWFYIIFFVFFFIIFKIGFFRGFINMFSYKTFLTNNLWYYHSFLWREYGLITFLGGLGLLSVFITKRKIITPIILYIIFHLFFILFIFKPYISRYLLPIFPLFLMGMSYTLTYLVQNLPIRNDRLKLVISVLLTLFIIVNGYKFVNKPKKYYSLNHDFREIANIDYHQVYAVIKNRGELQKGQTLVIDTWWDRVRWYLGDNFENIVAFRWYKEEGYVNGLSKKTPFITNGREEKILSGTNLRLVLEVSDLVRYMNKYPKGFLFIDDSSLPEDVKNYAEKRLKKELYLDHYPLDENPYSIWPATLYSWGV